ncbi:Exonuclease GOR, partial [Stegodyphus mimosarum]
MKAIENKWWAPLGIEQLHKQIQDHKLSYEEMQENGFPVGDRNNPGKVILTANPIFADSLNPQKQICRCGKELSLLEEGWYLDEDGCKYHPGKRNFIVGQNKVSYSCCKRDLSSEGCTHSKYHVSFLRPFQDVHFVQTECKINSRRDALTNVFALDCEMAFTTKGMEVVRVTLVNVYGIVVYDSYVKPEHQILDYNTAYSGVNRNNLDGVDTTLQRVQSFLLNLLNKDSILVGHGLANDLLGLNLIHESVVDTSCLFPHDRGFPYKHSLKHLAAIHLGKSIQVSWRGHNSIEDAKTCMELLLWKIYSKMPFVIMPWSLCPQNIMPMKYSISAQNTLFLNSFQIGAFYKILLTQLKGRNSVPPLLFSSYTAMMKSVPMVPPFYVPSFLPPIFAYNNAKK